MKEKILKLHKIILLMHTMETLRQSKNLLLLFFSFLKGTCHDTMLRGYAYICI